MMVEYTGPAWSDMTPIERVLSGLPFATVADLFFFIGTLAVIGLLIIFTVWKIASAIKGQDDKIFGGD
ncbi:MAG: hypothetical protein ACW99G_04810 [Candidatus Thorarchaeota archaeon]|jgi:hypothetical protein